MSDGILQQKDDDYNEWLITNVEESESGYSIGTNGAWTIPLEKKHGIEPKKGQTIKVWGDIGRPIRGIAINGETAFYRTPQQQEEHHRQEVKEMNDEKRAEFEEKREEYDSQYDELPEVFQKRIDRFRSNNPDFRWKYEPYELFCCQEAVKIAKAMEDTDGVQKFNKANHQEKTEMVDLGEGHSGNTMGAATMLAYVYLDSPKKVIEVHGALAPLVGSEEYGGVSKEESKSEKE